MRAIDPFVRLPLASRWGPEPMTEAEVRRDIWPTLDAYLERRNAVRAVRRPQTWLSHMLADDPMTGLVAVRWMIAIVREHERRHVLLARGLGIGWRDIARERGVSHQTLHARFASDAPGKGALATSGGW